MSICPICMRALCDHTAEERGQTEEEMLKPLSNEEIEMVKRNNEKLMKKLTEKRTRNVEFTEETVEKLKEIFNESRILEQQLIKGEINEDDFIAKSRELKFNIPEDRKRAYIDNVWYRYNKYENETDEEFKERVIEKLNELGINTVSMVKRR